MRAQICGEVGTEMDTLSIETVLEKDSSERAFSRLNPGFVFNTEFTVLFLNPKMVSGGEGVDSEVMFFAERVRKI